MQRVSARLFLPHQILRRSLFMKACSLVALLTMGTVGSLQLLQAQTKSFPSVTDAALQKPDPSDWINWRRTLDGWGYSPLKQINTGNVQQLQLAWSWTLGAGSNETTPLVYNGVMYIANPGGVV